MAELQAVTEAAPGYDAILDGWMRALGAISAEDAAGMHDALGLTLERAATIEPFEDARRKLRALVEETARVGAIAGTLVDRAETMMRDWLRAWRYTPAGVQALREELTREASAGSARALRRWLTELLTAIDSGELAGAAAIARIDVEAPRDLEPLRDRARTATLELVEGDAGKAVAVLTEIATSDHVARRRLTAQERGLAARLAAWVAVTRLGDRRAGRELLDAALEAGGGDGRAYAERAALNLLEDRTDAAAADARRAVDVGAAEPLAHLVLGACAERGEDAAEADELYRRGAERMTVYDMVHLEQGATLFVATGRALLGVARRLLEVNEPQAALTLSDRALSLGLTGPQPYPETEVYALRRDAHHRAHDDVAAAADALEIGRRSLWANDADTAVAALRDATQLDPANAEAAWLLSDATLGISWRPGEATPDQEQVDAAQRAWLEASERFGMPAGELAWAYLTRAFIEQLRSYQEGADREAAYWRAIAFVERTLVHGDANGHAFSIEAKFLRELGFDELTWEASERARELGVSSTDVDAERVALLGDRGALDEAEALAARLKQQVPDWPWLDGARAAIAFDQGRYAAALEFLEVPLSGEYDPEWYRFLAAKCHLALGDRAAAREQYADLVRRGQGVTGYAKCELSMAHTILGDGDAARRWLELAREDRTAAEDDVLAASSMIAFGEGRIDEGVAAAVSAVSSVRVAHSARAVRRELALLESALPDGAGAEARRAALAAGLDAALNDVLEHLESAPVSAEAEIAQRLEGEDLDSPASPVAEALVALRARRAAERLDLRAACDDYQRLREARAFLPEATIALRRLVRQRRDQAAETGELGDFEGLQKILSATGDEDPLEEAAARAEALLAAGHGTEAVDALLEAGSRVSSQEQVAAFHERTGKVALRTGDLATAAQHVEEALKLAERGGDASREAQLLTWLGTIRAAHRDGTTPRELFVKAIDAWRRAGAYEPSWTLATELLSLIRNGLRADDASAARETLAQVLDRLAQTDQMEPDAVGAIEAQW